ncbi:MAG: CPBP family intramembrane metalloprotease [Calditrichaeota bacterium]|nr:MAG: CPBP family intramembrane metalloprotease [Calditrichota bacterium]
MQESGIGHFSAYPTLKQSWGLLGILILITIVISALFIVLSMAFAPLTYTSMMKSSWVNLGLYSSLFILIILLGFRLKRRIEPSYRVTWKSINLPDAGLILVITLGLYFLIDPLTDLLPMPEFFKRLILELLSDRSIATVLMLVVAAPIGEELLFRGIILDGLLKNYPPKKAIFWSALFFGAAHLNPWQFIAGFILGFFMGWIYHTTRSLTTTVFIHFIANGSGVLLGVLLVPNPQAMTTTRQMVGNDLLYLLLLIIDGIILYGAFKLLSRRMPHKTDENLPALSTSENETATLI